MKLLKIFFSSLLLIFTLGSECFASPQQEQDSKEYSILQELHKEGNKNPALLLRLSEISPTSSEALCYARLGLEIFPNSPELANRIDSLRSNSKIKEEINTGRKTAVPSPSLLILMNFISKNQLSLILFVISSISILLFVINRITRDDKKFSSFQKVLYLSSIFLFFQLFFIVKTKDARFRLVSSFSDFNKIEAVVLQEKNVYAAPLETSQEINILKPSWEINIYPGNSDSEWHLVETSDKRQGWIKNINGICPIIN